MNAIAALVSLWLAAVPVATRRVAVTIDDLPGAPAACVGGDLAAFQAMTSKLLAAVKAAGAPAIGFVDEGKLAPAGAREEPRVALLGAWLDAGMDLGNHTYSHFDLHRTALAEFERDTVREEETTRALLAERGKKLRYFRHPFLHTGRSLETKRAFEVPRGTRIHHRARHPRQRRVDLRQCLRKGRHRADAAAQRRVIEAYVPYMDAKFDYFEHESRALFSREIPQVLLIHANSLNADAFGQLAAMMRKRGYAFVTLDDAVEDPAYRSPDAFTGAGGISWLHRWALTKGEKGFVLPDEPTVPKFVLEIAGVDGE